jgi:predicted transcriptional regulator
MRSMEEQSQAASNYTLRDKWGEALDHGFVVIPSILLRYQHQLAIGDGELIVLMHLIMSWWKVGEYPFPRAETIAKRMGVSTRTVQRHIDRLEKKKLIQRFGTSERRNAHRSTTQYDLSGLVVKLKEERAKGLRAQDTHLPQTLTALFMK